VSGAEEKDVGKGKRLVHLALREDVYIKLWEHIKRRYPIPLKKLSEVVNEAIEEYLKRHEG